MTSENGVIWIDIDAYLVSTKKKVDGYLRTIDWYCLSQYPKSWTVDDVIRDYNALSKLEQEAVSSIASTLFNQEQATRLAEWVDSELGGKTRLYHLEYKILGYVRDKDGNRFPLKTLDEILQTEEKIFEVSESLGFKAVGVMMPLPSIYKIKKES